MEPLYWLILLAVLIVIEIATLGLTTIWFAGGALLGFFLSMLGVSTLIQIVVFFVISFLLLFSVRPFASRFINKNRIKTNYESLIGKEAKVTSTIDNFNEAGTVMVNGLEWTARSDQDQIILEGTKVKIVNVQGVKLIVTDQKYVKEKKEEI